MVGNRGWIRIVEASIAILIIFGALIIINTNKNTNTSQDLTDKITPLLDEIALNETLRSEIINTDMQNHAQVNQTQADIGSFLKTQITNPSLDFAVRVCSMNSSLCPLDPYPSNEVFAKDRIVSSTLYKIEPKRLKIFLWLKQED